MMWGLGCGDPGDSPQPAYLTGLSNAWETAEDRKKTPKLRVFQVNKSPRAPVAQGAGPFPLRLPSCRASRKKGAVLGIFSVPSEMHPSAPRSPLGRLSLLSHL